MNKEEKKFVIDLYNKMLEGYFELDDFKKAFSFVSGSPEADANVRRMRKTISSYVNLNNLKRENGELEENENTDQTVTGDTNQDNYIDLAATTPFVEPSRIPPQQTKQTKKQKEDKKK